MVDYIKRFGQWERTFAALADGEKDDDLSDVAELFGSEAMQFIRTQGSKESFKGETTVDLLAQAIVRALDIREKAQREASNHDGMPGLLAGITDTLRNENGKHVVKGIFEPKKRGGKK